MLWQFMALISSVVYPTGIMLNINGQLCLRKDKSFNTPRNIILNNLSFVNLILITIRSSIMFSYHPNYTFGCVIQFSIIALHLMSTMLLALNTLLSTRNLLTAKEAKSLVVIIWVVSVVFYLVNLFELLANQFLLILSGVLFIMFLFCLIILMKCFSGGLKIRIVSQKDEESHNDVRNGCKFIVIPVIIIAISSLVYITPFMFYTKFQNDSRDIFWSSLDLLCVSTAVLLQPAAYLFLDKEMRKIFYQMWDEPELTENIVTKPPQNEKQPIVDC